MKKNQFHCVGGTPRSGSTLLCNVLAQNPRFAPSSTSLVAATVASAATYMENHPDMISELASNRVATEKRYHASLRGFIDGWYSPSPWDEADPDADPADMAPRPKYAQAETEVVFDKGRGWNQCAFLLRKLYPDTKVILVVRHLIDVFASVEKQARKNAMHVAPDDIVAKATAMFMRSPPPAGQSASPGHGMIGVPVNGIEDIMRRKPNNVIMFQYEKFAEKPEIELKKLYIELGEEWYDGHDFDNVVSVATDLDPVNLNNFPHEGCGKIEPSKTLWQQWVPTDVAKGIMESFKGYNAAFGYE